MMGAADVARRHARRRAGREVVLGFGDVPRLRTLGTVDDFEFNRLALFKGPEAVATDSGIVHEHVASTLAFNETVALGVIEPLDLACDTHRSSSLLAGDPSYDRWTLYRVLPDAAVNVRAQKKTASAYAASTSALGNAPQRTAILSIHPAAVKRT